MAGRVDTGRGQKGFTITSSQDSAFQTRLPRNTWRVCCNTGSRAPVSELLTEQVHLGHSPSVCLPDEIPRAAAGPEPALHDALFQSKLDLTNLISWTPRYKTISFIRLYFHSETTQDAAEIMGRYNTWLMNLPLIWTGVSWPAWLHTWVPWEMSQNRTSFPDHCTRTPQRGPFQQMTSIQMHKPAVWQPPSILSPYNSPTFTWSMGRAKEPEWLSGAEHATSILRLHCEWRQALFCQDPMFWGLCFWNN